MKTIYPKNKISLIIIAFFALLLMIPEQATAQRFGHFTPHAVMPRPMPMPRPEPRPIPPGPASNSSKTIAATSASISTSLPIS